MAVRRLWFGSLVFVSLAFVVPVHAAPGVDDQLHGTGTATTFTILGSGVSLEGGIHDRTLVCGGCFIRVTFSDASFTLIEDGAIKNLAPGRYEIRDFSGLFGRTAEAPGQFFIQIHGAGKVILLPPEP